MKMTLIQHSGFTYAGKPGFRRAVEVASIGDEEALRVIKAGGVVFHPMEAYDAEHRTNYPPEVKGLYPAARGTFSKRKVQGSPIYVPDVTEEFPEAITAADIAKK